MGVNKEVTPYFRVSEILQYTFGKMERRRLISIGY